MPKVDKKKRKFLKHLGILAIGGALGMALTKISARSTDKVIEDYSEKLIKDREKFIWNRQSDFNPNNMLDYSKYLIDVNSGQTLPVKKSGSPFVNEVACAYDTTDWEGKKHIGVYCTAPCKQICPVDAIRLKDNPDDKFFDGEKTVPTFTGKDKDITQGFDSKCIGCGKCFRICGYNAIHWVNGRD